jgi:hypothetical protein
MTTAHQGIILEPTMKAKTQAEYLCTTLESHDVDGQMHDREIDCGQTMRYYYVLLLLCMQHQSMREAHFLLAVATGASCTTYLKQCMGNIAFRKCHGILHSIYNVIIFRTYQIP